MNLGYLLLAHDAPNHFSRLVQALAHPTHQLFIHIDRKSNIDLFSKNINRQNAVLIQDRVSVHWGEFSTVQATINLMREALNYRVKPDYLILISGRDYPLRSNGYINKHFVRLAGKEFISMVEMPNDKIKKTLDLLLQYKLQKHFDNVLYGKVINVLNRIIKASDLNRTRAIKALGGLKAYAGEQWWALTADACRYILAFIDANPAVVQFFKNTRVPDESFFHTIIGNSRFSENILRNLTFVDWNKRSGSHPAFITMEHLRTLGDMGAMIINDDYGRGEPLFARKFPDESAELTAFINQWMVERGD